MGLLAFVALQISSALAADEQTLRNALVACDQASFTTAASLQSRRLTAERSQILEETYKLIEERTELQQRRERRRRNGPLSGIFNRDTNEVDIANAAASIRDRQAILSDRQTLLSMRADLLRSQIELFRTTCPVDQNG